MAKLTWAERDRLERLAERIKATDMPRQLDGMWRLTLNMTEREVLARLVRMALTSENNAR